MKFNGYNFCVVDKITNNKKFFREQEQAEVFIEDHDRPYDLICEHSKKIEKDL